MKMSAIAADSMKRECSYPNERFVRTHMPAPVIATNDSSVTRVSLRIRAAVSSKSKSAAQRTCDDAAAARASTPVNPAAMRRVIEVSTGCTMKLHPDRTLSTASTGRGSAISSPVKRSAQNAAGARKTLRGHGTFTPAPAGPRAPRDVSGRAGYRNETRNVCRIAGSKTPGGSREAQGQSRSVCPQGGRRDWDEKTRRNSTLATKKVTKPLARDETEWRRLRPQPTPFLTPATHSLRRWPPT